MDLNLKPSLAADEMFSEGPGYMEMDEVSPHKASPWKKPNINLVLLKKVVPKWKVLDQHHMA